MQIYHAAMGAPEEYSVNAFNLYHGFAVGKDHELGVGMCPGVDGGEKGWGVDHMM